MPRYGKMPFYFVLKKGEMREIYLICVFYCWRMLNFLFIYCINILAADKGVLAMTKIFKG